MWHSPIASVNVSIFRSNSEFEEIEDAEIITTQLTEADQLVDMDIVIDPNSIIYLYISPILVTETAAIVVYYEYEFITPDELFLLLAYILLFYLFFLLQLQPFTMDSNLKTFTITTKSTKIKFSLRVEILF